MLPTTAAKPVMLNLEDFLDVVRKSELVPDRALDGLLERLRLQNALPTEPKPLAVALIKAGLLTTFQAKQLLIGKYRGFVVNDKYKLLELIAVGGMGTVYLCEHIMLRRLVAVKVLPTDRNLVPTAIERFQREARAIASLDHPNIVRAFDLDRQGQQYYLIMEYVDGNSLDHIIQKSGPLDVLRACHYIRQAALGLQNAHEGGWLHRDIKPSNILLSRHGVVKILDMGLARLFMDDGDNLTREFDNKNVLGTADYISPEQAMSSTNIDIRADVYSLGATFYFLLTGRPPFQDGSMAQKLIWHQMRFPDPIPLLRPDVPAGLDHIVQRMMAKDPAQRYQSPAEAADALAPWTMQPIAAPPTEEMPQLIPLLARYLAIDAVKVPGNSGVVQAPISIPALTGAPTRPSTNDSSSTVIVCAASAPTWRGRVIEPEPGAAPRGAPGSALLLAQPQTTPNPAAPLGKWMLLCGLVLLGVCVTLAVVSSYQVNRPPDQPPKSGR